MITDRPTTRLHAPPGGHSSISFGADVERDVPRSSRETQQSAYSDARSNVRSQVFGAPSDARAQSSNAYANGADQNCGNCITDRPSTRLHAPPGGRSQIAFGDVDNAPTETRYRPDTAAFAAKEREQQGSDIFGAAPPQRATEAEPTRREELLPAAPASVEATEVEIKAMTHGDLRVLCRAHGLSPAGAKETLVERIVQAMHSGKVRVMVDNKGACGVCLKELGRFFDVGYSLSCPLPTDLGDLHGCQWADELKTGEQCEAPFMEDPSDPAARANACGVYDGLNNCLPSPKALA